MAVKHCCIKYCNSSSVKVKDKGVTFHKFPKEKKLYKIWLTATKYRSKKFEKNTVYVCSRHSRKVDFENYKHTKYVLKSGIKYNEAGVVVCLIVFSDITFLVIYFTAA